MNNLQMLKSYINWYATSKNLHGVHSPFMYNFMDRCLYARQDKSIFEDIEFQRARLIKNRQMLTFQDPGAGARNETPWKQNEFTSKSIRQIAKRSLQPPKYARLLHRIAGYFQCKNILEMGTSFGITTAYMSKALKGGNITTIEGVESIADIADGVFHNTNCDNINLHRGDFSDVLPDVAAGSFPWDMIYLDGNHNGKDVLNYFSLLVKHINTEGVMIFDDIRWSPSMWQAWNEIKNHRQVGVTADLFFMGLVFFNPALSKEHFSLRF